MKRVEVTFVDKDGTVSLPMSTFNVPSVGHRVQLHTGPPAESLPNGAAMGHSLELWKVIGVTWDSWLATATIEVRRC